MDTLPEGRVELPAVVSVALRLRTRDDFSRPVVHRSHRPRLRGGAVGLSLADPDLHDDVIVSPYDTGDHLKLALIVDPDDSGVVAEYYVIDNDHVLRISARAATQSEAVTAEVYDLCFALKSFGDAK